MKNNLPNFLSWASTLGIKTPLELLVQNDSSYHFMALSDSDEEVILNTARSSPEGQVDLLHVPTDACIISDTSQGLAEKLAFEIAACPPLTVQGTKDVIIYSRDHGIKAGLNYVAQKNAAALPSFARRSISAP